MSAIYEIRFCHSKNVCQENKAKLGKKGSKFGCKILLRQGNKYK